MQAKYFVFEGLEGCGKSTHTNKLANYLSSQGYKVLCTKEPGTPHAPITMQLRGLMLDKQHDEELTPIARELISQAIRSIHLEKVVIPAMEKYDYIIQDRGILSGLAYGSACGNDPDWLVDMAYKIIPDDVQNNYGKLLYDTVIYLKGDIKDGLKKALSCKKEFKAGDAMEAKGSIFLERVGCYMNHMASKFNTKTIFVEGKTIDEVFKEILQSLNLEAK